ncbi:MAG TPA: hypothetical protein VFV50_08665 [Bdellovibrionales bacterium]|nr:hypothetical protein [Bdellovibrionales bacterium]
MKKKLLSLAIAFHLTVIAVYPNSVSYFQRDLLPVILPYANTFGLNSKWQFFAPEPEIATYFEYEIDWREKPEGVTGDEVYKWPPEKKGFFDFTYTRRNSSRSFMFIDQTARQSIFISWICRQHPQAAGVSVRAAYVQVPSLEQVKNGQPLFDPSNVVYSGEPVVASCEEALRDG